MAIQPQPVPARTIWSDPVLWGIILFALLFRIGYNLALHAGGHGPASFVIDEREYFGAAHVLVEGRGFSFFDTALWVRAPLYVIFLAPLAGTDTTPVMIVQSLLSAATLLPLALLAYRLGGLKAARWTALLGALYLPFTLFAGLLLSETLFVFLFAVSVVTLLRLVDSLREGSTYSAMGWAIASGLLLGLAVLTRATALAFVPLAAIWLLFANRERGMLRSNLIAAGVTVLTCLAVLVPWTVRNYASYHRFMLVDTTSGYNLWLGSVGVRDEPRLQADLRSIPNPVDKQTFAYQRAWENISNDPLFFVSKGLKESLDLWRPLFQAEEHQVSGYALGRVPSWHLVSVLLLDDYLYLGILMLAIAGLLLPGGSGLRGLTLLWVLLWVAMSFVFFAVTRFRFPVVALLIPWAGTFLSSLLRWQGVAMRRLRPAWAQALAAIVGVASLFILVPGISFTMTSARLGSERWSAQEPYRKAEVLLKEGKAAEAAGLYKQADISLADTRYGLAAAYLQQGTGADALALLTSSEPADRVEPFLIRGEAARLSGDLAAARTFFNERAVRLAGDYALQWAWDHFNPPPVDRIDVGSGLDIGYIRGFYTPETGSEGTVYRWSGEDAEARNLKPGQGRGFVTLSGWRPAGTRPAGVTVTSAGNTPETFMLDRTDTWQTHDLPGTGPGDRFIVNGFVPGGSDPRLLGVRVSTIGARK